MVGGCQACGVSDEMRREELCWEGWTRRRIQITRWRRVDEGMTGEEEADRGGGGGLTEEGALREVKLLRTANHNDFMSPTVSANRII